MTTTQPFDFRGFLDHLKQTGELAEIHDPSPRLRGRGAYVASLPTAPGPPLCSQK